MDFSLAIFPHAKKKGSTPRVNNCCGNPTGSTLEQVLDTALQRTSTASMRHLANVTSWLARFPAISMIFCNSRFLWFHVKQIYYISLHACVYTSGKEEMHWDDDFSRSSNE